MVSVLRSLVLERDHVRSSPGAAQRAQPGGPQVEHRVGLPLPGAPPIRGRLPDGGGRRRLAEARTLAPAPRYPSRRRLGGSDGTDRPPFGAVRHGAAVPRLRAGAPLSEAQRRRGHARTDTATLSTRRADRERRSCAGRVGR